MDGPYPRYPVLFRRTQTRILQYNRAPEQTWLLVSHFVRYRKFGSKWDEPEWLLPWIGCVYWISKNLELMALHLNNIVLFLHPQAKVCFTYDAMLSKQFMAQNLISLVSSNWVSFFISLMIGPKKYVQIIPVVVSTVPAAFAFMVMIKW